MALAHPPQYIHTHHPRRGSLTPLGLNVISPVSPFQVVPTSNQPHSPVRSLGFSPTASQYPPDPYTTSSGGLRRGSGASSTSTLTQTRPGTHSAIGFNRDRRRSSLVPNGIPVALAGIGNDGRRSSLTPSVPTLAPPSPTRAHVSGRVSRPTSSDGKSPLHSRPEGFSKANLYLEPDAQSRRGSLPHLQYGGWHGSHPSHRTWNPSLPTQRGSVEEAPVPEAGFKFGSAGPTSPAALAPVPTPAPSVPVSATLTEAEFHLKESEMSPARRARARAGDVFAQAEEEEAERQRKAFIAATYGEDGRRARERLTLGAPVPVPANSARRPSLMLWEKLGMAAHSRLDMEECGPASAPGPASSLKEKEEVGPRRGSLPIAIPGGGLGRATSRRRQGTQQSPSLLLMNESGGEESDAEDQDRPVSLYRPGVMLMPDVVRPSQAHAPSFTLVGSRTEATSLDPRIATSNTPPERSQSSSRPPTTPSPSITSSPCARGCH
jgi:hypothetical protein